MLTKFIKTEKKKEINKGEKRMFSFNSREKKELIAGTLIFVFVGLTINIKLEILIAAVTTLNIEILFFLFGLSLIIFPLWLFHELRQVVPQNL